MKRVYIGIIIVVVILGIIFVPKYLNEGDKEVKFKVLKSDEVPQKLKDILPNYISEERALSCKIEDDLFVVVTRGEKNMEGYSVTIDKIEKGKKEDNKFNITVFAKYKDPNPDQIVAQKISYPYIIVKTNLDKLPANIKLEVEYEE